MRTSLIGPSTYKLPDLWDTSAASPTGTGGEPHNSSFFKSAEARFKDRPAHRSEFPVEKAGTSIPHSRGRGRTRGGGFRDPPRSADPHETAARLTADSVSSWLSFEECPFGESVLENGNYSYAHEASQEQQEGYAYGSKSNSGSRLHSAAGGGAGERGGSISHSVELSTTGVSAAAAAAEALVNSNLPANKFFEASGLTAAERARITGGSRGGQKTGSRGMVGGGVGGSPHRSRSGTAVGGAGGTRSGAASGRTSAASPSRSGAPRASTAGGGLGSTASSRSPSRQMNLSGASRSRMPGVTMQAKGSYSSFGPADNNNKVYRRVVLPDGTVAIIPVSVLFC
jgi:hypothetical protein